MEQLPKHTRPELGIAENPVKWYEGAYAGFILAFFYLPLIPIVILSFNDSRYFTGFENFVFTMKWYDQLMNSQDIMTAMMNTITIAVLATIISTFIGTLATIALTRTRKVYRDILLTLNQLPIVNPEIVTAVALLLLFVSMGLQTGFSTMLLAHITFTVPYVIITMYPKVASLDKDTISAAQDLGATPWQTLWKVLIPQIKESIVAGAAIAFTMSFDDFIISYFTGGSFQNISIFLYSQRRHDPTINALSTVLIAAIGLIFAYNYVKRRKAVTSDDE